MYFLEADVHTKESLGNAAATWVANMSAWTATAVAAKFYRSQSDTGRPQRPPLTGKAKPASLGMLENPNEDVYCTRTFVSLYCVQIISRFSFH